MAEATRVEAEADTHHILAEAEASAEEDFHQEEVSAEDGTQRKYIEKARETATVSG